MRFTSETSVGNKRLLKLGRRLGYATAALTALLAVRTMATADDQPASSPDQDAGAVTTPDGFEKIVLQPGNAQKVTIGQRIKRANILIPDIADVVPLGPNNLLITAKKPGMTQLIIWDDQDHTSIINVVVASDIEMLRKQIKQMFPTADITVEETGGALTLHGQVTSYKDAEEAGEIASTYGKVLNLLEVAGGEQIMLQVKIAEVSKQAESQLGFNFGGTDGTTVWGSNLGGNTFGVIPGAGTGPNLLSIPSGAISTAQMFGTGQFGNVAFAYFVNALESNNILRLLAEPNLVTTSGQEAHFLAGGQFPYPVPQTGSGGGGTTITIQFQPYGVDLKFVPIVLGNGHIRLKVEPNVSELDFAHAVSVAGTTVPGLTQREVETTVEMCEGQTLALAGLLQDNISAANAQFPVLGDLPVIGALFRSVQYQRNETEVVIMVTPVLVHPMNPGDVTTVPGEKWRDPTNPELYMFKDLGGEDVSAAPPGGVEPMTAQITPAARQNESNPAATTVTPTPIRPVPPVTVIQVAPTASVPAKAAAAPAPVAVVTPAAPKQPAAAVKPAAAVTPTASVTPAAPTAPTPSAPTASVPAPAKKPAAVPADPSSPPPLFQGQYGFSPANGNQQQTAGASDSLK
jgi:pilus assembly protein CpaC